MRYFVSYVIQRPQGNTYGNDVIIEHPLQFQKQNADLEREMPQQTVLLFWKELHGKETLDLDD